MIKTTAFKTAVTAAAVSCAMALMLAFAGCGPKKVMLDFSNVPDNERCQYMKDICKEAEAFQAQFERMTSEEKTDARQILNAYIQQCEGAQEMCRRTME